MKHAASKFDLQNRSLFDRLFEPPAVGKMAPVAKLVVYSFLAIWSFFVLFPIYWVIITSFKDAAAVNQGPSYLPFVDFMPTLDAWRVNFTTDPFCDSSIFWRITALSSWCRRLCRCSRWNHRSAKSISPSQIRL